MQPAWPADLDVWVQQSEQQFSDIRPGDGKRIIWAGAKGAQTPLSIVYIHGFSASPAEIRPVPDEVARAFGGQPVLYPVDRPWPHRRGDA